MEPARLINGIALAAQLLTLAYVASMRGSLGINFITQDQTAASRLNDYAQTAVLLACLTLMAMAALAWRLVNLWLNANNGTYMEPANKNG